MNPEIQKIIDQIHSLEKELEQRFRTAEEEFYDSMEDGRIRFTQEIKRLHKQYRVGVVRYILSADLVSIFTAPIIYGMAFPLMILDISITLYQHVCFRAYGIPRVRRRDYIVIDRHKLAYLNLIEKMNCAYCGYGNGLIAYVREIISRTEEYWCPIRHAQEVLGTHKRYNDYFAFGDAEAYHKGMEKRRCDFDKPDE